MPKERLLSSFNQFEQSKKKWSVPLFLPMGFDEMFREESRFQTKKRGAGEGARESGGDKRRGDTNKCHFGKKKKGTGDRREQLDGCNKRENGGLTKGT